MDITVPLSCEVPIQALHPALLAFFQAAREAEALSPGGEFVEDGMHMESRVWKDFLALIGVDRNAMEGRACSRPLASPRGEQVQIPSGTVPERIEEQVAALEVDLEAKEELVEKVMAERDELRAQNEELKEGGLHSARGLGKMMTGAIQGVEHLLGLDGDEEQQEEGETDAEGFAKVTFCDKVEEAEDVDDGSVLLSGHFAGNLVTRSHFLEVALPLDGSIPGAPLLEIVGALAGEADAQGNREVRMSSKSPSGAVDPKVWRRLVSLLRAELPPEALRASAERRSVGDGEGAVEREALQAEVQRLRALLEQQPQPQLLPQEVPAPPPANREVPQLDAQLRRELEDTWRELKESRASQARLQVEAEELRARNTTLAGYLASAESNAQKLRSTLSNAGAAAFGQQDSNRPYPGAAARAALAIEASKKTTHVTQRPPPVETMLDPPGTAFPGLGEISPQVRPKTFGGQAVTPLSGLVHSSDGHATALFRTPCSTSSTPKGGVASRTSTPRLKLTDAALVADLQELERWAKELRALKAA